MRNQPDCISRLQTLGISWDDANSLRRIAMTLHRWHEGECGDSNNHASRCIVRGTLKRERVMTEQGLNVRRDSFEYSDDGKPYIETHYHNENGARYYPTPDREAGAKKRLAAIMARYPELTAYIQGDPRGASLYILRADDIPADAKIDSCYNRGVAVYQ